MGTSLALADVDTTKDPCQKVKCSRHKVCVAQGYQRAVCVNRKKLERRWAFQIYRTLSSCALTIIQDSVCFLRVWWIPEAWCHAKALCRMQLSSLAFRYSDLELHIKKNHMIGSKQPGLSAYEQIWLFRKKSWTAAKKEVILSAKNFFAFPQNFHKYSHKMFTRLLGESHILTQVK